MAAAAVVAAVAAAATQFTGTRPWRDHSPSPTVTEDRASAPFQLLD
ncbi:MAG: hypothetical protein ACYCST_11910 [Acidimicrobiales bacterium]